MQAFRLPVLSETQTSHQPEIEIPTSFRQGENPALCSAVLCGLLNHIFHKQSQSFLPSVCINTINFIVNRFKMVRN